MLKILIAAGALVFAGAALADDKTPVPSDPAPLIDEAKTAYAAGEISHARRALELAAASVSIKQGEAIKAILPKPFDSWTVAEGDTANLGMMALGGGLSVDRTYNNADGSTVRIEILADSELVAQMASMLSDPAMLAASGAKTDNFGGETGIIDPSSGQITIYVDKRSSFTISGSAKPEILKSYAQNINFAGFRAIK